ncbi:hypothetical protein [Halobacillus faecis]|uniref:HTH merR-type domain-containing protein n=1 Tax=Halobacillus faecis TaxID=360184 RepID=A0A511WWM1_9BACI|nr:hypothetical protein [Halobacillus faecis]GEN55520.1 hypothetical protein HFA01_37820 [Halobacillus faecis]
MGDTEYGFLAKYIAQELEVTTSTLRRWCLDLEHKHNYEFDRNEKNQRIFYKRDLIVLNSLKKFLDKSLKYEDALKAAITEKNDREIVDKTLSVHEEKRDENAFSVNEVREIIDETARRTREEVEKEFRDNLKEMYTFLEDRFHTEFEKREKGILDRLDRISEQKLLEVKQSTDNEQQKSNDELRETISNQIKKMYDDLTDKFSDDALQRDQELLNKIKQYQDEKAKEVAASVEGKQSFWKRLFS